MKCLSCGSARVKYLPQIPAHQVREGFVVARALGAPTATGPIWRCPLCGHSFDQGDVARVTRTAVSR